MNNLPPEYRGKGEFYFLKMMAEEIEKAYMPGSTFTKESQLHVFRRFQRVYGAMYTDSYLKSRFKQLKKRYKEFSDLLNQEGIYWNKKCNIVYGNEKLLRARYKRRYKHGICMGEEHFDLMCQIFGTGVTIK